MQLADDRQAGPDGRFAALLEYCVPVLLGSGCAAAVAALVFPLPAVWLGTVGMLGILLAPVLGDDRWRVLPREGESAAERLAVALLGTLVATAALGALWVVLG